MVHTVKKCAHSSEWRRTSSYRHVTTLHERGRMGQVLMRPAGCKRCQWLLTLWQILPGHIARGICYQNGYISLNRIAYKAGAYSQKGLFEWLERNVAVVHWARRTRRVSANQLQRWT